MITNSTSGFSRRRLLGGAAASLAPTEGPVQRSEDQEPMLLYVFLRGGMDGLTTCVPYGDEDYYAGRKDLAIPKPGKANGALDLDGFFGLAPAAAPLMTPFKNGHLALVHASGSTDPSRSHFNAFKYMEFGIPEQPLTTNTGWLTRHLMGVTPPKNGGTPRAVALEQYMPQTLAFAPSSLPIPDPAKFRFPGSPETIAARWKAIEQMYGAAAAPTGPAGQRTLSTIKRMGEIDFAGHKLAGGASYPDSDLGRKLRSAATLFRAGMGIEVVMVDRGDWDLHGTLGPIDGKMAFLLDDLTRSLEAFYLDMLDQIDNVLIVVQSEFGRRVKENASGGTDHGHGNCLFVIGSELAGGGKVTAKWPGLAPEKLSMGDLDVTLDYRDIMGEILAKRMGNKNLEHVFPNHEFEFPGIVS